MTPALSRRLVRSMATSLSLSSRPPNPISLFSSATIYLFGNNKTACDCTGDGNSTLKWHSRDFIAGTHTHTRPSLLVQCGAKRAIQSSPKKEAISGQYRWPLSVPNGVGLRRRSNRVLVHFATCLRIMNEAELLRRHCTAKSAGGRKFMR